MGRPIDVTIVAVFMIIKGIIFINAAVFTISLITIVVNEVTRPLNENLTTSLGNLSDELGSNPTEGSQLSPEVRATITSTLATIALISSAIGITIGITCFVLVWGLFKGKGWARIATVILAIISVALSIVAI